MNCSDRLGNTLAGYLDGIQGAAVPSSRTETGRGLLGLLALMGLIEPGAT